MSRGALRVLRCFQHLLFRMYSQKDIGIDKFRTPVMFTVLRARGRLLPFRPPAPTVDMDCAQ